MNFYDETTAESWLSGQSKQVVSIIASRAAARGLPIIFNIGKQISDREVLSVFRGMHACLAASSIEIVGDSFSRTLICSAEMAAVYSHFAYRACHLAMRQDQIIQHAVDNIRSSYPGEDVNTQTALEVTSVDSSIIEGDPKSALNVPLWPRDDMPNKLRSYWQDAERELELRGRKWAYWRGWYQGLLDGKPLDWELQRRVALIPDADWEKGPAHIAEKIEEIREAYQAEKAANAARAEIEKPVPPAAAQAMAKRLAANREAIALTAAGLLEQIGEFREKIRGDNQLDPDLKKRLLALLDDLSGRLKDLLGLLPPKASEIDDETGERGVRWLRGFKVALLKDAREFVAPENVAGAAIPTAIILGCTGVGSLLGMPVAGTVVGGLLTGQLKPGKAVDDLLKPGKAGDG